MRNWFFFLLLGFAQNIFSHDPYLVRRCFSTDSPVILDCGAHNGTTARFWKSIFPNSTIYAVEADPENAYQLFYNVQNISGIYPFHLALSDTNENVVFYPNVMGRGSEQGSLYKQSRDCWFWDVQVSDLPITIPSRTLDRFCEENNIEKIDFLFLDMQGGELQMLKKSSKILPNVTLICTEVLFEPIYEGAPLYQEVKEFLELSGFEEIRMFYYDRYGDAYFVKKK